MLLLKPIFVLVGETTAHAVDDHKYDGRGEDTPNNDKQQFHKADLTPDAADATPAMVGLPLSAEMATDRPKSRGISAYVPFFHGCVMLGVSQKEDAPWMNSAKVSPRHQIAAGSVFLSLQLLWFWFCSTRFLRVVAPQQPLIRQPLARPIKAPLYLKNPHQPNLLLRQRANKPKTTHNANLEGGRSNASAFALLTPDSFHIEACPC